MRTKITLTAGLVTAAVLTVAGCSSGTSSSTSSPSAASSASSSSSTASGGPPSGGGSGGPGGGMQQITAVNLNSNGDSPGGANTAAVVKATNAFLATLDDTTKDRVAYDFTDNKARQTWSNFPATTVPREGVQLSALTADQLKAAYVVLQTALSSDGYTQDENIQKADDELSRVSSSGASDFGALKDYYMAVYGTPSATDPFMVQFGGHHLARNLTYNGDKVSQTPQFVGSEPTSFQVDGKTVEPVKPESTSMFAMIAGLSADEKKSAEITSGTFDDLLMGPGKDSGGFPTAEGLSVSKLDADHKKLVTAAIKAYAGDLSTDAATKLIAKYESELDQTTIGWANNTGPTDENSYIRIDGPSVWIEFINTRSRSTPDLHFHTVYRDKTNDYGSTKPAAS
jgi:Protein of unknown function (DUF3500)